METTKDFFGDENYEIQDTSNYTKYPIGDTKVRALSSAIKGYEYFRASDNKPERSKTPFEDTPDIKTGEQVKEFWAFIVWNYKAKRIQIMEVNKKSMMEQMMNYIKNPDWGSPKGYDMTITRKGASKNDTKYTITASPHKPLAPEIVTAFEKAKVNLEMLYTGADPFTVDSN